MDIHDPGDPEPSTPGREGSEEAWTRWSREHDAWSERLDGYLCTPEGKRRTADLESRVALTEKRASVSCELCGAPGRLHHTPARCAWYKTLCGVCAEQANYVPAQVSSTE